MGNDYIIFSREERGERPANILVSKITWYKKGWTPIHFRDYTGVYTFDDVSLRSFLVFDLDETEKNKLSKYLKTKGKKYIEDKL